MPEFGRSLLSHCIIAVFPLFTLLEFSFCPLQQQRFAAVTIFYFGLLHIADNESAAVFRPLHWLDNLFRIGSGGFGRNRIRLVLAGQPFGDHPHGAVHVREDVEQVGRLTVQLLQPSLQVGGILLTGRRGEAQQRPA